MSPGKPHGTPGGYDVPPGASAADFSRRWFGRVTRPQVTTPTITTSVGQLVKNNPTRLALTVVNNTANQVNILPTVGGLPSSTLGFAVLPNGGSLGFLVEQDGEITGYEWQAIAVGGNAQVTLFELLADAGV